MKKTFLPLLGLLVIASFISTACATTQTSDLLADIQARGYIIVANDPNYMPQSGMTAGGKRPVGTKCPLETFTSAEMEGFDVEVAREVATRLGVEVCFLHPQWDDIVKGSWKDQWDISIGSMTITDDRREFLDFSIPYYYTPAAIAVRADSPFQSVQELAGQTLCVGKNTTYETWLKGGNLGSHIPILVQPPQVNVVVVDTDQECAQAIKYNRQEFIGYATSITVIYSNLAEGLPVRVLGGPVYLEPLVAAFDKASSISAKSLAVEVDRILAQMHADGTLTALSLKWFQDAAGNGIDYTVSP